ncbi:fungal-specific transcription factor domain-containing protein [Tricladium varicosporioides]|nr:fungal-specific transcription factor domain-containing protein [Hymenoscyphus varicosporioides]
MSNFVFVSVTDPNDTLSKTSKSVIRSHTMQRNWNTGNIGTRRRRENSRQVGQSQFQIEVVSTLNEESLMSTTNHSRPVGLSKNRNRRIGTNAKIPSASQDYIQETICGQPKIAEKRSNRPIQTLAPTITTINFLTGLSLSTFPVPLDKVIISTLHHFLYIFAAAVYPLTSPLPIDPVKSTMFPLALTDTASFYAALSAAATHQGSLLDLPESPRSLYWRSTSLQIINERLAKSSDVSNGTMTALISLGSFELFSGNGKECLAHVSGLAQIIKLRGGIDELKQHTSLHRFAVWFDTAHACRFLQQPRYFDRNERDRIIAKIEGLVPRDLPSFPEISELSHFSGDFHRHFRYLRDISLVVNNGLSAQADINSYTIAIIASDLLREKSLGTIPRSVQEQCLQLGMIAFLSHLMVQYQSVPMIGEDLFAQVSAGLVETQESWEVLDPWLLWIVFMVGSACPTASIARQEFARRAKGIMERLQCLRWTMVENILKELLWMNVITEKPCLSFLEEVVLLH